MSSALVSLVGSVDWCCFPYLDSPSHFGAFTNEMQGGHFQIAPQGEFSSKQRYRSRSLVLDTLFETPTGQGILTDWMPTLDGPGPGPVIHRKIEVQEGSITWALHCSPRFCYGKTSARAEKHADGILFRGTHLDELGLLEGEIPFELTSDRTSARCKFTLRAGQCTYFEWGWGRWALFLKKKVPPIHPEEALQRALGDWRKLYHECTEPCRFSGPWHDSASRSSLMTHLFTAPYSGSITEGITGNLKSYLPTADFFTHSYTSIRDCGIRFQVLLGLSDYSAAKAYFQWLQQVIERDAPENLHAFYSLDAGHLFPEGQYELQSNRFPTLQNRRRFQLDLLGHVFLVSTLYYLHFKEFPDSLWDKLAEIAEFVCESWKRPDYGHWDIASRPKHFVLSKLFCWVTLNRAHWLATELGKPSPAIWRQQANILHQTILQQGYDEHQKTFIRAFGEPEVDSSCLWIPFLNFLPIGDSKIQGTLKFIRNELTENNLVRRCAISDTENRWGHSPDFWGSFMWVSCLALSGKEEEARRALAEHSGYSTPLGLFGDYPRFRQFNTVGMPQQFPSASSHFLFLNAVLYVTRAKSKTSLGFPLIGETIPP